MANTSLDSIRSAMASTNEIFNSEVVGKRNFDALDQVYTADARILPPGGQMVSGRASIKEFWASAVAADLRQMLVLGDSKHLLLC